MKNSDKQFHLHSPDQAPRTRRHEGHREELSFDSAQDDITLIVQNDVTLSGVEVLLT